MRIRVGRLAVLVITALSLGPPIVPEARAATTPVCARHAQRLHAARKLNPGSEARRLRRLHREDPACVEAPEAAFEQVEKVWDRMLPQASGPVSRAAAVKRWARFRQSADFVEAIVAFERAPSRPRAMLALGRLYDAMATYLDQVGTGPDDMVVIKEVPESLYHSRAVNLSEHLKIRAEHAYESVLGMYPDARYRNVVIREARQRLHALRGRHEERRADREPRGGETADEEGATRSDPDEQPPPEAPSPEER